MSDIEQELGWMPKPTPEQVDAAIAGLVDERNHYMNDAERLRKTLGWVREYAEGIKASAHTLSWQKEYARQLLAALDREGEEPKQVNPYTGRRFADEEALDREGEG
jgi:hypothetical protein